MSKRSNPVKIKHIAEYLGLSQSTVSFVLNGRGDNMRIAKSTQNSVWDAAKELNYSPSALARKAILLENKIQKRNIAIFWSIKHTDQTMGNFFKGISAASIKQKYNIEFIVQIFEEDQLAEFKNLMTIENYSGIIICFPGEKDIEFLDKETLDIPLVISNKCNSKYSGIYVDHFDTGKHCANLFAENGLKSAGIIGISQKNSGSRGRRFGFISECERLGIEIRDEWIIEAPNYELAGGYHCANKILDCKKRPSGIFILTDMQAIGVMIAFKDRGIRIPEDMEVLAYGYSELFDVMVPSISSVVVRSEEMAEKSVILLMTMIENNIKEPISKIILPEYRFRTSFPHSST